MKVVFEAKPEAIEYIVNYVMNAPSVRGSMAGVEDSVSFILSVCDACRSMAAAAGVEIKKPEPEKAGPNQAVSLDDEV